ncbi:MAG: DoxX family protein [Hyphomicrobiaceae bacterium]
MNSSTSNAFFGLAGRFLLSAIFVQSGWGKIGRYASTQAYMEKMGVPGSLLPLVIATELGLGLLIVIGWQTRIAAFLIAGFTLLAGILFHYEPGNSGQMIQFMKNIAIAGGFLMLVANGPGPWSIDGRSRV